MSENMTRAEALQHAKEDIAQTKKIMARMIRMAHQAGVFEVDTGEEVQVATLATVVHQLPADVIALMAVIAVRELADREIAL